MRTFWIGKTSRQVGRDQNVVVIDNMSRFRGHRLIEGDAIVFDESAKDLPDYWQLLEHAQVLEHLRRSDPSPKPQPKTIRVRIAVAVGSLGPWDSEAYTVDAKGDEEARQGAVANLKSMRYARHEDEHAPIVTHIVMATVPLPESVTVEGEVVK